MPMGFKMIFNMLAQSSVCFIHKRTNGYYSDVAWRLPGASKHYGQVNIIRASKHYGQVEVASWLPDSASYFVRN